jgi:signal transduction histidine kinase
MNARERTVVPAVVAGTTAALAATALVLALTTATDPAALVAENRANQWLRGLAFGMVGALVLRAQTRNRLGPLMAAIGIGSAVASAAFEYATFAFGATDPMPGAGVAAWIACTVWLPPYLALVAGVPLLFPDGHLPSRRWRGPAWAALVAGSVAVLGAWTTQFVLDDGDFPQVRNPVDLPLPDEVQLRFVAAGGLVVVAVGLAAVIKVALGMRHADSRRRQQSAWFVAAVLLAGMISFLSLSDLITFVLNAAAVACLAIGIVRHGLFDIELALSRAVVYTMLTTVALGGYFAAAVLLGAGTEAGIAPAMVAAAVALLLASGRQRLQTTVDRLMYGERRDPLSALTSLGERLGGALDADEVLPATVDAVRRTLNLPYAEVRLAGEDEAACASGTLLEHTAQFPLSHAGVDAGVLVVGLRRGEQHLSRPDARLLEVFARQAAVAAHGVRITRELRRSRERVVTSREEERRRIRRELHDGLGPALAGITLGLETAGRVTVRDPDAAYGMLRQIRRDAADCVAEVRRIVSDLHPPALDDVGLLGALRRQADLLTSRSDGLLQVTVDGSEAGALSSAVEVAAYRIATEAMANTARHAAATRCRVTVRHDGALHVSVVDDGNGVPPARPGTGLTSMRERAEELGGSCTATFSPGTGTRVEALLPTPTVATR